MKSFIKYLFENTKPSFLFALDHGGEMNTSHYSDKHQMAFPNLFGGKDSDFPPVWGRVENGVARIVTENGREPVVTEYKRQGKRLNKYAIEDANHRINATKQLASRHPDLIIHTPNIGGEPFFHSPDEHIKYLIDLMN